MLRYKSFKERVKRMFSNKIVLNNNRATVKYVINYFQQENEIMKIQTKFMGFLWRNINISDYESLTYDIL